LGLQAKKSTPIDAWLHQGSNVAISAQATQKTTVAVPINTNTIWRKNTVRYNSINISTSRRKNKEVHTTSMWEIPIPRQSHRQHATMPHQRNSIAGGVFYQRYTQTNTTTTRLSGNAIGGGTNIPSQRNDSGSAQQRQLPERTESKKQGRRTFLPLQRHNSAPKNGAVLKIAHIIKHVMTSATEAELAGLYIMAREAVYIRIILDKLGHKQPPTPLQTDNSMAEAVTNGKVQPKRTKAMDMRFHWLRDRECQQQFRIYWRPGRMNYADYWTKHHPTKHHQNIRKEFITPQIVLEMLRQEKAEAATKMSRNIKKINIGNGNR
jgi:hypothetical protein